MTASFLQIRELANNIRQHVPSLGMGSAINGYIRDDLRTLAAYCGLDDALSPNDADLISIYLTAIKDPQAAIRVAAKVAMRLDPLAGVPGTAAPDPFHNVNTPAGQPKAPTVDLSAIRAMIKEEVKTGALDPLQRTLNAMDTETSNRFELMASELENVQQRAADMFANMALESVTEALRNLTPTRIEISLNGAPTTPLGLVHRDTAKVINALAAGVNVYLHGPAGSGKTTLGRKAAEAFDVPFYFAAKVESEYQLMGFKDAKGDTVRTPFRDAYEHGGMFLFDELDASSPSAVVALNAALANGICPFPDAIVTRHANFKCLGAGNTKLTGANRQYAGRNQLDAASIDRFAFIEFNYDDDLERALATDASWCKYVQSVRTAIAERGLNHLVTPRATYDGCRLLAAGFDRDTVKAMCVYKGLDADTVAQIERAL